MERSYLYPEQLGQMQATYDAFVMLKIAHDAGCDLHSEPIDFYCYEFGYQIDIFIRCIERIFGECKHTFEGLSEYGEETNTYRIPLPELKEFFALVGHGERDKYIRKFNGMLKNTCDYYELEMEGVLAGNCMHITLSGSYGLYSPMLKRMVAIKKEIQQEIRKRKQLIVNGLRNLVLLKMVWDRLGKTIDVSMGEHTNIVFSRLMQLCQFDIALGADDNLSFDTMKTMLETVLSQAREEIDNHGKGEAA